MGEPIIKEKTIANLYSELNRLAQNGEYERALKTTNKIIGVAPLDSLAFRCKIVCLIEMNKFEDAIQLLNKKSEYASLLIFEKAYSCYRANQHEEALNIIAQSKELDGRTKELKAQVLYRLERYDEAAEMYREIIKNSEDQYEDERFTNLSAAMVYTDNENTVNIDELHENTYELSYNKACLLIGLEQYSEAERKLRQCEKMCREMLEEEEEASEEEIDIELALIRIQLAYVFQKQGRFKEAQQLYTTNLKLKLEDIALSAVASNNLVCINKDQNLFDSKKKMKTALNDALKHKLPSDNRKFITLNNAILSSYIHQIDQCEKICNNIDKTWPDLSLHTVTLRSANLFKANKIEEAIKLLKGYKPLNEKDELVAKLAVAQYYLIQGEKLAACKVLEDLGDNTYKPAIVGALTTIYLGLGQESVALRVFEKSVDWYKKNKVKGDLTNMWRQAADFHIRNGHAQVAANSLEELLRNNKDNKKLVAQLILALSQFDIAKALNKAEELPSIAELTVGLDLEGIQSSTSANIAFKKSPAVKQDSLPGTPSEGLSLKNKKHKKKKGKLPKNYIAGATPDPERWLPKYERSGFRKKRDRRAKEIIKGSQGTASGQTDQFDFSKYVEQQESAENSPVEPSPRTHATHPRKPQKKKNKRR